MANKITGLLTYALIATVLIYSSITYISGATVASETVVITNNGEEYVCNVFPNDQQPGFEGFTRFCGKNNGILFNNWEPYFFVRSSGEEVWL